MTGPDPSLREKIRRARTVGGVPPDRYLTSFTTIPALLRHRSAETPDRVFLVYLDDAGGRTEWTYRDFHRLVCRTAHALARAGIGRGDRVATVAYNHADTVVQYFACWCLGAVVVPVNAGEDDGRIAFILKHSEARLAFVREEFAGRIEALAGGIGDGPGGGIRIVTVGGPGSPFHAAIEPEADGPEGLPDVTPEDEALIVYTSGTTGNPKGVLLVQYNLLADARAIAEWHAMTPDQRMLCVLPIHHVNGIVVTLVTPLWYGGSVALMRKFHTGAFWPAIAAERVTVASVVPTLLQFLLHAGPVPAGVDIAGFRHVICGAGPLTCELAANFESSFGIPIIHGYGLSETTCYSCFLPADLPDGERARWLREYGFPSIGVPLPVNEMAIHDDAGNSLPERSRGEIVIRGHNVMRQYFAGEEVNRATFEHGWFRSGDEGFFIRDGSGRPFFFITGRLKELIIRGGVNISPFEIDEVLMNLPGVGAGLAVAFENDWYGEEVGAYVRRSEGSTISAEEVIAGCRRHLAFGKCPKVVVFGDEVPVTSTGKYQRTKLRPLFAAWKTVQFSEGKGRQ